MKKIVEKILFVLARGIVVKYHPDIIGITGSVGKTSTREAVVQVFQGSSFRVRGSIKSYNNELGVPLTIIGSETQGKSVVGWFGVFFRALRLLCIRDTSYPQVLVLEMGAQKKGDIATLTKLAPPRIAILTALAPTHLEFFGSFENIVKEKFSIFSNMSSKGHVALLNADMQNIPHQSLSSRANVLTFGFSTNTDMTLTDISHAFSFREGRVSNTLRATVAFRGASERLELLFVAAQEHLYSVAAALCVARLYDISLSQAILNMREYTPPPGRMRLLEGVKQTLLIDDSYNSSPLAVLAALESLVKCEKEEYARRIVVFGDMLELGEYSQKEHENIGQEVMLRSIDVCIAVGQEMRYAVNAMRKKGFDEKSLFWFDTVAQAGKKLQEIMRRGDIILIKGSRGIGLERVVKEVMAHPERAHELLVNP